MSWRIRVQLVAAGDEADPGRTIPIATTADASAVHAVADAVIREARHEARVLRHRDPLLGRIASEEAGKLSRLLRSLETGREPEDVGLHLVHGDGRG